MRGTSSSRSFATAPDIRTESATGRPAVEMIQKSAYISYAELKYPMPSVPRYASMGILYIRPMILTEIVEIVSKRTPDRKLFCVFSRINSRAFPAENRKDRRIHCFLRLCKIMRKHLAKIIAQTFLINGSILPILIKYASIDHGHFDVACRCAVCKHCVIVIAWNIGNCVAIK